MARQEAGFRLHSVCCLPPACLPMLSGQPGSKRPVIALACAERRSTNSAKAGQERRLALTLLWPEQIAISMLLPTEVIAVTMVLVCERVHIPASHERLLQGWCTSDTVCLEYAVQVLQTDTGEVKRWVSWVGLIAVQVNSPERGCQYAGSHAHCSSWAIRSSRPRIRRSAICGPAEGECAALFYKGSMQPHEADL